MSDEAPTDAVDPAAMSFEQAVAELESIIDRIEQGDMGLEESLAARRRGEALVRRCRSVLEHAEQEITRLDADADEAGD